MISAAEEIVAQACVGSELNLNCPQGTSIQLLTIRLADSRCFGAIRSCCPRPNDCWADASSEHRAMAMNSCNGQRSCSVATEKRKIPCGLVFSVNNDYERITYRCIGELIFCSLFTPNNIIRPFCQHFVSTHKQTLINVRTLYSLLCESTRN